jgi:two-component system chemotaxis sensor kinase CheA
LILYAESFLEDSNNIILWNKIFRILHNIKGTSGFLYLPRLEELAHATEDALQSCQGAPNELAQIAAIFIAEAAKKINRIVNSVAQSGMEPPGNDDVFIVKLNKLTTGVFNSDQGLNIRDFPDELGHRANNLDSELKCTSIQPSNGCSPVINKPPKKPGTAVIAAPKSDSKIEAQPFEQMLETFSNLVHRMSEKENKNIRLHVIGAETKICRKYIVPIRTVITHMARNSIAHGLECPAERQSSLKPECGSITLIARQEENNFVIDFSDDGRGLSPQLIKEKAVKKGFISRNDANRYSESQLLQIIFESGFSTVDGVTKLSGRGIGMDIIRSIIDKMNGSIEVYSTDGKGARFIINIPCASHPH